MNGQVPRTCRPWIKISSFFPLSFDHPRHYVLPNDRIRHFSLAYFIIIIPQTYTKTRQILGLEAELTRLQAKFIYFLWDSSQKANGTESREELMIHYSQIQPIKIFSFTKTTQKVLIAKKSSLLLIL